MTAIEYLEQIKGVEDEISLKKEEIAEYRAKVNSYSLGGSDAPKSINNNNSQENKVIDYIDNAARLESEIEEEINIWIDIMRNVRNKINTLPDRTSRMLLIRTYSLGQSAKQIFEKQNECYEIKTIYNKINRAIEEFKELYDNNL